MMRARPESAPASSVTAALLWRWLRAMRHRRIAVIGDAILDMSLWGDAVRISPEAPVPVVLLERQSWALGGAANVAANIVALGGRAILFSPLGRDAAGQHLHRMATRTGIEIGGLPFVSGRVTTVKSRLFARNKHMVRMDREDTAPISPSVCRALCDALRSQASAYDAVIISDYAKGCVTPPLVTAVRKLCQERRIPWVVDPKGVGLRYPQVTVLKPNLLELELLSGRKILSLDDMRWAARRTLRRQKCRHLLVTRGQQGMALYDENGSEHLIEGSGQPVADVTGAGDTVAAALALGLAARLTILQAANLARLAASLVVGVPGTAVARGDDLLASLPPPRPRSRG